MTEHAGRTAQDNPERRYRDFLGVMKTDPHHLPPAKRRLVDQAVHAIRELYAVEMIILFGSYARGDWTEDHRMEGPIHTDYVSDIDLLVITASKGRARQIEADDWLHGPINIDRREPTPSVIAHGIDYVNQMLSERRYFFYDIYHQGYRLYDSKRYTLVRPPDQLKPKIKLRQSTEYFADWLENADQFAVGFQMFMDKGEPYFKKAAFNLHQAAEAYFDTFLLVYTGYRPPEHNLRKLLFLCAGMDTRFRDAIPLGTEQDRAHFDLLNRAYVGARYKKNYHVTEADLLAMAATVQRLRDVTDTASRAHLTLLQQLIEHPETTNPPPDL